MCSFITWYCSEYNVHCICVLVVLLFVTSLYSQCLCFFFLYVAQFTVMSIVRLSVLGSCSCYCYCSCCCFCSAQQLHTDWFVCAIIETDTTTVKSSFLLCPQRPFSLSRGTSDGERRTANDERQPTPCAGKHVCAREMATKLPCSCIPVSALCLLALTLSPFHSLTLCWCCIVTLLVGFVPLAPLFRPPC